MNLATKLNSIKAWAGKVTLEEWSFYCFLCSIFSITFSIALGETMLLLSLLLYALYLVLKRKKPVFPLSTWFAGLFLLIAIASIFYGENPQKGMGKLSRLFWFVSMPLSVNLVISRERMESVLKWFAAGCGLLFVDICMVKPVKAILRMREGFEYEDWNLIDAIIDMGSMTDGQMILLGVLSALGFLFLRREQGRKYIGWFIVLMLFAVALVINCKRGSWFAGCLVVGIFVMWRAGWKAVAVLVLFLLAALATPLVRERLMELEKEFDMEKGGRATMWLKVAPGLIADHPFGYGYGSMTNEAMIKYASNVERGRKHVHNNCLQVLVETGWHGLIAYSAWMLYMIAAGLRSLYRLRGGSKPVFMMLGTVLLMITALYFNGLVEYNFGDTELLIVMLIMMGIIESRGLREGMRPEG